MPGRWRSDSSPWVKPLMELFPDNRITDISVMCSAQSSKTQTLACCACWAISEDPGPAMWVMAAKDEAKTFVRDRIKPTFENCDPVAASIVTADALEFTFGSMPFYFTGAGSPSKLQSKPIRWLFLDEVRNYPPGALDTVLKRTRAFWNSRRIIISTPKLKDDAVHRAFLAGDQRVFHFHCPSCSQLQPLKFEQLKAQHPETGESCLFAEVPGVLDADKKWNFDLLSDWIRYECVACKHLIKDTPSERKAIARNGEFVRMNPKAPRHRVSFQWNAMLPPWVTWRSIVEEYIHALAAVRTGDLDPLRAFINETLGEPWEDKLGEIDDFGFLEARRGDYDFGDAWPEARVRFMAADRQEKGGEHYFWVIRDFGLFGKSRLVAYGRCNTTAELEETRKGFNVKVLNCIIDSGFKAQEVYRFCAATGWKAFKGDSALSFMHYDARGKAVRKVWRKTDQDPHYGTKMAGRTRPIPLFSWANDPVKDMLAELMKGLVGDWTIPKKTASDYLRQVTAERREERVDSHGRISFTWHRVRRDNHYFDCELMILVAAVITKIVAGAKAQTQEAPQAAAA
jgi:phage terminase large subunit GpA-like protein